MRGRLKIALTLCSLASIVASAVPLSSHVAADTPAQLQARRAALEAQLSQMDGPRGAARDQLVAAEQQEAAIQQRIDVARAQQTDANQRLHDLSGKISEHEHTLRDAQAHLRTLIRVTYESNGQNGLTAAVLSANSFSEAVDRMRDTSRIAGQVGSLRDQVMQSEKELRDEQIQLQAQADQSQTLESQLGGQGNQLAALVAQRNILFQQLDGPARQIAQAIADIDRQLGGGSSGSSGGTSGSCSNRFSYGYCTYYVAGQWWNRRQICIPWAGNAADWWANARSAGFAEGQTPQVNAIVVFGRTGSSPVGHVAIVDAVGPAGLITISEMNYKGWNVVDSRPLAAGGSVLGYVYGPA